MKVSLRNIGKKYEGRENFTLRGINLEIDDKDFCVILGPSGCGKSTLLRMIAGLNSITEGDMYFGDRRVNNVQSKDRDIAMVFQSYALYPHMSVKDNLAFSLKMKKENPKVIEERVQEAAKTLQIEEYLHSKPSEISGGQRQRVALGRAMVRKPKIFLMDEPLSNLDAKLREHMRVELVRLHKDLQTTSIYVTHDQTEAMTMATKIVLLQDGTIQQVGNPEDFYQRPENIFVATFIGSPTMNLLSGRYADGVFKDKDGIITIHPDEEDRKKLDASGSTEVVVGIRSERFLSGDEHEDVFQAEIDVIEMLGKEKLLYAKLKNGKEVVISVPGHFEYAVGETHNFGFDTTALHYFDAKTTERIT